MDIAKIKRPPKDLVEKVREVGAATASATLAHMGIRNCFMVGPVARSPGQVVAGPCVTLQMMPKREDLYRGRRIRRCREAAAPARALPGRGR